MLVIMLLFLLQGSAYADSYTFTLDVAQESALAFVIEKNAAGQDETLSKQDYLQSVLTGTLSNYIAQYRESQAVQASALKERYDAATPEQRNQIDAILSEYARKQ